MSVQNENRDYDRNREGSIRPIDDTEATLLSEGTHGCFVMNVGDRGDTEEQHAHQAAQSTHSTPHVSLSQVVHTVLRTLKEASFVVKTFLLQLNMSRNKEGGPCSR